MAGPVHPTAPVSLKMLWAVRYSFLWLNINSTNSFCKSEGQRSIAQYDRKDNVISKAVSMFSTFLINASDCTVVTLLKRRFDLKNRKVPALQDYTHELFLAEMYLHFTSHKNGLFNLPFSARLPQSKGFHLGFPWPECHMLFGQIHTNASPHQQPATHILFLCTKLSIPERKHSAL